MLCFLTEISQLIRDGAQGVTLGGCKAHCSPLVTMSIPRSCRGQFLGGCDSPSSSSAPSLLPTPSPLPAARGPGQCRAPGSPQPTGSRSLGQAALRGIPQASHRSWVLAEWRWLPRKVTSTPTLTFSPPCLPPPSPGITSQTKCLQQSPVSGSGESKPDQEKASVEGHQRSERTAPQTLSRFRLALLKLATALPWLDREVAEEEEVFREDGSVLS